ncbi:MAG: hypothetical protein WAT19_17280 [Ferruginibacter sp.]
MKNSNHEIITSIFSGLLSCKTITDVDSVLDKNNIGNEFRFSEKKYPKINFTIQRNEIENILQNNSLSKDYCITDASQLDTLGKILYALAWKNGDLQKIKHIIKGILAKEEDETENAVVFVQFGKYLSGNPVEPIVDQHVLRAFDLYQNRNTPNIIEDYSSINLVTKKHVGLITEYKIWLNTALTKELRQLPDYRYHVDKVLFATGKYLKNNK